MIEQMSSEMVRAVLTISGVAFLILSLFFPALLKRMTEHGGRSLGARFIPGHNSLKEAVDSVTTSISIVSSIVVAATIILFERSGNTVSILLSTTTLLVFSVTITFSLYLSLIRPLTGTAPSPQQIYLLSALVPLGLGFAMFTVASIV